MRITLPFIFMSLLIAVSQGRLIRRRRHYFVEVLQPELSAAFPPGQHPQPPLEEMLKWKDETAAATQDETNQTDPTSWGELSTEKDNKSDKWTSFGNALEKMHR